MTPLPPSCSSSISTIHLLRALYRQSSLLFDPIARSYTHARIRTRFRQHQHSSSPFRCTHHLKTARSALSLLTRANDGHENALNKILSHAYGRIGKRRHDLLSPLLAFPRQEALVDGRRRSAPPATSPILNALLEDQNGRSFKAFEPIIPETNAWGRPFPTMRKVNMLWRTRSDVLRRVLPPLPKDEFELLEAYASGVKIPTPPKRRFVRQRIAEEEVYGKDEKRVMTRRAMRRTYEKLVRECPVMEYVPEKMETKASKRTGAERMVKTGGWKVRWSLVGGQKIGTRAGMGDFEGVDEDGKSPPAEGVAQNVKKTGAGGEKGKGSDKVMWEAEW